MGGVAAIDGPFPEDDFDLDAYLDWLVKEIDEGRQLVPPGSAVQVMRMGASNVRSSDPGF